MENIKFRQFLKDAYRKNGESFHYWGYISDGFVSPVGKNISDFEGAQYTGIKDDSGREIYEGDIVHHCRLGLCEVIFDRAEFHLRAVFDNRHCGIGSEFVRVIGNIHENIELLGKSNA